MEAHGGGSDHPSDDLPMAHEQAGFVPLPAVTHYLSYQHVIPMPVMQPSKYFDNPALDCSRFWTRGGASCPAQPVQLIATQAVVRRLAIGTRHAFGSREG